MALPKAIEAIGERAEELQKQFTSDLGKGEPAKKDIPVETPPKKEDPQPVLEPPKGGDPEDFKQKYMTLKGKYDAEVRRLHSDNTQMSSELTRLRAEMDALKTSVSKPADTAGLKEKLEKLETEYGGEFTATLKGLVESKVREGLQPFENQLKSVETKQVQTASERFFSYLDANTPDWEATNSDPEFLGWLSNKEPFSGKTYRDLLVEARDNLDPLKAANIFRSYTAMAGHLKAMEEKKGEEIKKEKGEEIKKGLESMIEPGKSGAPDNKTPEKKTYTRQGIAKFYKDVADGVYRGREAEQKMIEADVFLAQQEGRIV